MADAFQVTRPLLGRAGTAARARGDLITHGVAIFAGRAGTATNVRGVLIVYSVARPGVYASARLRVAGVLADLNADWEVHPNVVDSVTPPAFMLAWSDPWSTPVSVCYELAALDVICVAGRIDADPGIETVELMVASALGALTTAGIADGATSAPRLFEIGGVPYLSARIPVSLTVNVGVN